MKPAELPKEFIEQFDYKKNKFKISDIKKFSITKVWWKCSKGHSWHVAPSYRNRVDSKNGRKFISMCPHCYNNVRGEYRKLAIPDQLVKEFDRSKNQIELEKITKTYNKSVWWKCNKGHSWFTSPVARLRYKGRSSKDSSIISMCPTCQRLSTYKVPNHVMRYFNQKLNPMIKLDELHQKSPVIIKWQCPKNSEHIWEGKYLSRASPNAKNRSCPYCSGNLIEQKKLFKSLYPKIFSCIIKNNKSINYELIPSGSGKKLDFKCPKGDDHIFTQSVERITGYKRTINIKDAKKNDVLNCPFCRGDRLSITNSLNITHPYLANMFDEHKNNIKVTKLLYNSNKKYWWKCTNNHSFQAAMANLVRSKETKYKGCNICTGKKFDDSNSLKKLFPKIFNLIHRNKNKGINLNKLTASSSKEIIWQCPKVKEHHWKKSIVQRIKHKECPFCTNYKLHKTNSLGFKYPEIAKQLHPTMNKIKDPFQIKITEGNQYYWICKNDSSHIYKDSIRDQTIEKKGCPMCSENFRWNRATLKTFLYSIKDHIETLTPAEKFLIFQQTGLPEYRSKSRNFIKNFASGQFPKEEIEKFLDDKKSLVDDFIDDNNLNINDFSETSSGLILGENNNIENEEQFTKKINEINSKSDHNLPFIETKQVLKTLSYLIRNVNQEAIEFLIASAKHKIWRDVFRNEKQAILDLKKYNKDEYVKRVQFEFLNEYNKAKALKLPKGYSFEHEPNLMQKLTAAKVIQDRRVGNWSGTGAGKTLSAILASRYIGAKNVVVCCPNALAQRMDTGWANEIVSIFPDSNVRLKSFDPLPSKTNNFYVLNFEAFQQKDSSKKIVEFLNKVKIDFVIIDEIHYSKQRQVDNLSLRKKNITSMLAEIQKKNKKLHVLGMSATPVINNLYEGRSLVEMITGEIHKDLPTQININNCMKLHQKLMTIGLRWMPDYKMKLKTTIEDIDCSHITNDVKELGKHPTPLDLEKLLTREKIQTIKKHIEPKTLIYTHYLDDIANYIKVELEKDGYKVGFFTGDDKSGLEEFKNGSLDVLIGSRTIGTGVNGLQDVCKKIIINSLPWTHAEYEQLIGRVYRQGQKRDVEIFIPLTEGTVNGKQWSWCKSRYDRIKFKKTVGDAAVDGVIPSEEIRTESQVLQDLMKWIARISGDDDFEIKREPIKSEFVFDETDEVKRIARYGDFSKMNREWNNAKSSTTHEKIKNNPDLWNHYHQMFEEHKKKWTTVPSTELIKYFKAREGLEIGDFGCGKALLHQELSDKHIIHSFDHHAFNSNVIACDISKTPLNNKQLDVAIFSLSLMGSNIADYIIEANRTLKLDGRLFLIESTSRFKDINQFKRQLIQFGFDHLSVKEMGKFTQVKCDKVKDINLDNSFELYF